MQDIEAVANTILRAISESPTKTLTGGRIRDAILAAYPSFRPISHGATNLRDFIRNHVRGVREQSRAGMDIVYAISDVYPTELEKPSASLVPLSEQIPLFEPAPEKTLPQSDILSNYRLWKAFASPHSPWKIFLDPETGFVSSLAPNELRNPSSVSVPPCSPEFLLSVATAFVDDQAPEPFRPILTRTLTEKKWWLPFFEVLKNYGLRSRWTAFRREKIAEEFERTVAQVLREHRSEERRVG